MILTGTNLDTTTGVFFNGVAAQFTILSPTQIRVTVPAGATSGPITVTTLGGSATTLGYFVVLPTRDFSLAVAPATATVIQGSTTTYQVSASGTGGFAALITLQVAGLPAGVSGSFSPKTITAGQAAVLTLTAATTAALTTAAPFSITGTAQPDTTTVTRTTSATLTVLAQGGTNRDGRVVDTDGLPIQGVAVSLGAATTATDASGNFLLRNLPSGAQVVVIDGGPASTATLHYPLIPVAVTLTAGVTNQLPYVPYLHAQKNVNFTPIDPTHDTIATDPDLPGVALRIPAGTQIIGLDGQPNQMVSIRTVPIDRLPIKPLLPQAQARTVYMFYFGKQGGGIPTQPIPFTAPNDLGLAPGDKADLWYFDESPIPGAAPNDWRTAGTGTVSADGQTIATDPGVGIPKFCCGAAAFAPRVQAPPTGTKSNGGTMGGEPVDLATGSFTIDKTDLVLPGRFPIVLTRSYLTGDSQVGAFGRGWQQAYDVFLNFSTPTTTNQMVLVLPNRTRYLFNGQPDGSFRNTADPAMHGAVVTLVGLYRVLTIKDQTVWRFDSNGLLVARSPSPDSRGGGSRR